jgi:hypothetical protein
MKPLEWFERQFSFGFPPAMLPFFLERLEGTMLRLERKVANVPDNVLSIRLDGKWSIKENIAHLAEVDEIALMRMNEIHMQKEVMSPAVFQLKDEYNSMPISQVYSFFEETRKKNIDAYRSIKKDDLTKTSTHPRLKLNMSVIDLAYFDAEHDDHHLLKITNILNQQLYK